MDMLYIFELVGKVLNLIESCLVLIITIINISKNNDDSKKKKDSCDRKNPR